VLAFVEAFLGLVILAAVFYDLFQSVMLPRPAVGKLRLSTLILRPFWAFWKFLGTRLPRNDRREDWLGTFGPLGVLAELTAWGLGLIVGFGLLIDALRDEITPVPANFWTSLYFSAGTLFPLSYGDIVPTSGGAEIVVLAESATGVILIALVVSLLFSLYGSFQRREELVVALDALAGAPPSGLQLLETIAKYRMWGELKTTFDQWRSWSAAVLESHLAYPILVYFRSSHDNEAWLNSFGAVMDAAALVQSTLVTEDDTEGHARLLLKVGNHLVEDVAWYFRLKTVKTPIVERSEYEDARERLIAAGYRCHEADAGWERFAALRTMYASALNLLALRMAIVPARWIGDRSYVPHLGRPTRAAAVKAGTVSRP
jgi:hypothetical protein